jgi:RNA polymerase sigma factor (sigma-70 family)
MTFIEQQKYIKSALRKFTTDSWLIDELSQTINIKLHTSQKEQNRGLLYSTIRSVYIDHYRKVNSKKSKILVYAEIDGESSLRPDDVLIKKQNKEHLLKCIDKLPEKQKEVVYLRYYCNLDYFKICDIMKCPKNTALSYIHKAKANLKSLLTKTNNYEN